MRRLLPAVGLATILVDRMESSEGPVSGYANNVDAVRRGLEAAGVEFIEENGGGPGVRLEKSERDR